MAIFAAGYLGIVFLIAGTPLMIHSILNPPEDSSDSLSTEDMLVDLTNLAENIMSKLEDSDLWSYYQDTWSVISTAKWSYDEALKEDWEEMEEWASDDQVDDLEDGLLEFARIMVDKRTSNNVILSNTLIEKIKEMAEDVVKDDEDSIYTATSAPLAQQTCL